MKKRDWSVYLNVLILLFFTLFFIFKKNYEFISYTIVLGILIFVLAKSDKIFNYSKIAKFGFTIWMLLHLSGGSFYVNGTKLYDLILIPILGEPFNFLKYDQFVHFFCYVVLTLFVYAIIKKMSRKETSKKLIGFISVLSGVGIGAFNEIIEFLTVVFFQATGVGGYYNNALDLVFNTLGAMLGAWISLRKYK